ncbi:MAG: GGDEF domain-containing protein [Pseudomonas sp.]|jgi:diguanylate cyclase (GGDEF)-like protein|uniref:GGDEF domain-containing protein n=1 Tax=Ectopseudomonas mendocina TaxID=300 RepID=UPI00313308FE
MDDSDYKNHKNVGAGLRESDKRVLMRTILLATSLTLGGFAVLQALAGNYLFAILEVLFTALLLFGAWRIGRARHLYLWIYLYLIPTFSFFLYIIVMPNASSAAFVWLYMIPLLAYLLLGKQRAFLLAALFMLAGLLLYFADNHLHLDTRGLIDVGNAALCGVLILLFVHIYDGLRMQAYEELERLAQTDALTGVASRGSFQQALQRSIQEAERSNEHLVLVLLDVDYFKQVNDQWGHEAGDMALQHICQLLQQRLRITDFLGRLGGEEFGLLLRHTDGAGAAPLVEKLRKQIAEQPLHYGGEQIALSATFGLAAWPVDGRNAADLYRTADRRLYSGKQRGRNQLVSTDLPVELLLDKLDVRF